MWRVLRVQRSGFYTWMKQDPEDGPSRAVKKAAWGRPAWGRNQTPHRTVSPHYFFGVYDHGVDCQNAIGADGSLDRIDEKHATQAVPPYRLVDSKSTDKGAGHRMPG